MTPSLTLSCGFRWSGCHATMEMFRNIHHTAEVVAGCIRISCVTARPSLSSFLPSIPPVCGPSTGKGAPFLRQRPICAGCQICPHSHPIPPPSSLPARARRGGGTKCSVGKSCTPAAQSPEPTRLRVVTNGAGTPQLRGLLTREKAGCISERARPHFKFGHA